MRTPWKRCLLSDCVVGLCCIGLWIGIPRDTKAQNPEPKAVPKSEEATPNNTDEQAIPKMAPGEKPPSLLIVIPDEPKTVDPGTLYPEKLTVKVTANFDSVPLRSFVKWMEVELKLSVQLEEKALSDEGISSSQLVTDHAVNTPLYQVLNRILNPLLLDWYFEDETLVITTQPVANEKQFTNSYNIGDLVDDGFKTQKILSMINGCIPGRWEQSESEGGGIVLLGDVLFIRNSYKVQHQIAGLLQATRKHGRRTFTFDPANHEILREKLNQNVDADFDDEPLVGALEKLSSQLGIEIRLDEKSLSNEGISIHAPVSVKASERPLHSILGRITKNLFLAWILEDGSLVITTQAYANDQFISAVFDVRDLCRNQKESDGLKRAIMSQTNNNWEADEGNGGGPHLSCPKPGILVSRQNAKQLDDILSLLENYRLALRSSKVRSQDDEGPQTIVTKYHRIQKDVAVDVEKILPELVLPETWKSPSRPDAPGSIRTITSTSQIYGASLISKAVLVIRQTRENHDEINKVLQKILHGDQEISTGMGDGVGGMGGGMGGGRRGGAGGMGGFGGGYFSIPTK